MGNCTAADYTLRLHSIPPHTRLDQLEDNLRCHFEDALDNEKARARGLEPGGMAPLHLASSTSSTPLVTSSLPHPGGGV